MTQGDEAAAEAPRPQAAILDGKALASRIEASLTAEVETFVDVCKRRPRLVVVLVGDVAASASYVKSKQQAAAAVTQELEAKDAEIIEMRAELATALAGQQEMQVSLASALQEMESSRAELMKARSLSVTLEQDVALARRERDAAVREGHSMLQDAEERAAASLVDISAKMKQAVELLAAKG